MLPVQIRTPFLFRKNLKRNLPESWNELTRKQLIRIVTLIHLPVTELVAKYTLISILLNLSTAKIYKWFTTLQIASLMQYTKFVLNDIGLTKQLLPVLKVKTISFDWKPFKIHLGKSVRLYGPGDNLKNLTYEELIFADGLFLAYFQKKDIELLNQFVAALYRPARTDGKEEGDQREPFNRHTIEKRAKLMDRVSLSEKLAVYFFFQGCRKALVTRYPDIFSGGESDSKPVNAWLEMSRHIPNDKFGTIKEIMDLNMHFVLMHLNGTIKDTKESEKYLK